MADSFTITVDTTALLAVLDRLGDEMKRRIRPIAEETANRIAKEASARARRAATPTRGGRHMADQIVVQESRKTTELASGGESSGVGYVVFVRYPEMPGLAGWMEHGTVKMGAHPFLFPAARLEEGNFLRRVTEEAQDILNEKGLGE